MCGISANGIRHRVHGPHQQRPVVNANLVDLHCALNSAVFMMARRPNDFFETSAESARFFQAAGDASVDMVATVRCVRLTRLVSEIWHLDYEYIPETAESLASAGTLTAASGSSGPRKGGTAGSQDRKVDSRTNAQFFISCDDQPHHFQTLPSTHPTLLPLCSFSREPLNRIADALGNWTTHGVLPAFPPTPLPSPIDIAGTTRTEGHFKDAFSSGLCAKNTVGILQNWI
ncbi:hypothetical protein KC338_g322 [Hortaea werneckii]|nr:hypothetical protein KC338_g322 [Hortaea werneckii]